MNQYRKRNTGEVFTEYEVRLAFPLVSFPATLDHATLATYGYDPVLIAPAPATPAGMVAVRDGVKLDGLGNWVYAWRLEYQAPEVVAGEAARAALVAREAAKVMRTAKVDQITVEVDGMVFDGDEVSQGRMARAIIALETVGRINTPWVLSNNIATEVTPQQLRQALVKAGLAQTAVWVL
jgi:hypothetical protein